MSTAPQRRRFFAACAAIIAWLVFLGFMAYRY